MKGLLISLFTMHALALTPMEKEAFSNMVSKQEAELRKYHSDHTLIEKKLKVTEKQLQEIVQKYQQAVSQNRMLTQEVKHLKTSQDILWQELEKNGAVSVELAKKFNKKMPTRLPASVESKK